MPIRPTSSPGCSGPLGSRGRIGAGARKSLLLLMLASMLGVAACQSADGGAGEPAPVVAKAGARTSAFRDIGKRSASDLTVR